MHAWIDDLGRWGVVSAGEQVPFVHSFVFGRSLTHRSLVDVW